MKIINYINKYFCLYSGIGIFNTIIHWVIFFFLIHQEIKQGVANYIAFIFASLSSYTMNSRFTFNKKKSLINFIIFFLIMSFLQFILGGIIDIMHTEPFYTVLFGSILNLIFGYKISKKIVFRG
ncbi:GtrA family protein [Acinetobacter radioresistens]|uniref:GtrA family protein n=2 Tax=Acinetobacter radioresistens TaxID=40216 RepID=UPI0034DB7B58